MEENYQRQLKKQGEEIKTDLFKHFEEKLKNIEDLRINLQSQVDDIRKMFYTLQSETIEPQTQALDQGEQCIATNIMPPAIATSDNLEEPGLAPREIKGTYLNWGFSNNKIFNLIPISEMKMMLTKLEKLDITAKPQKAEGMKLIKELKATSESITMSTNRRFPPNGDYYYLGFWVNDLHDILQRIDNTCVNVNYNHSKNVIFNQFSKIGANVGWAEAYNCAGHHYLLDVTTPESRVDQYLWLLCCLVNIDKNSNVSEFEVYNVDSFEKENDLTWTVEQ